MAFTILDQGSFVSTGAGVSVPLPSSADYFVTRNITQLATTQATGRCVMGEWFNDPSIAANSGIRWKKTNSTSAMNADLFTTSTASDGFTYVTSFPSPEAAVSGTTITQATAAVVTMTNTYAEGDRVILYGTTGMLQISGMSFTISSVTGSGFTLLGLDSSGFASPGSACIARRIPKVYPVEPEFLYVTAISQASQAEVTVSIEHSYVVGQLVRFNIPSSCGMSEINGKTGKIVSATGTDTPTGSGVYKFTVDIDSSGYSAFALPASSGSPTTQLFPTVAPAGQKTQYNTTTQVQTGYNFNYVPFHSGLFLPYMYVAGGAQSPAGSNGDTVIWQAWKAEN